VGVEEILTFFFFFGRVTAFSTTIIVDAVMTALAFGTATLGGAAMAAFAFFFIGAFSLLMLPPP
jgi:hypothetical protein